MKLLLIIMAIFEGATGIALLVMPVVTVSMLLGAPLDTPAGVVAGRIAGAALIALAIACWQGRNGEREGPAAGLIGGMLFYNTAAAAIIVYAGFRLGLQSPLMWPAIVLHSVLSVWCAGNLWLTRRRFSKPESS